ncbi:MAG: hypothetical protein ACI38U_07505 [Corynebacterium sp.]|uniref:hypothetical protein n=1 Tax=unclassified Corynebacterium TaxID=2624378 RepID=UPI001300E7C7|nr:hypothetical protein [Corynebacterium sp. CNJ-954]
MARHWSADALAVKRRTARDTMSPAATMPMARPLRSDGARPPAVAEATEQQ